MSKVVFVIDSWFLMAISGIDRNDYPKMASHILEEIDRLVKLKKVSFIYIIWPVYYETFNTKLVRNPVALERVKTFLRKYKPLLRNGDDVPFRESSLGAIIGSERSVFSLVDKIISEFVLDLAEKHPLKKFILITNDYPFYKLARQRNVEVWVGRDYA